MSGRVCVLTGSRAEYGILRPVLRALDESDLDLELLVTGMHLSQTFGHTVDRIVDDGFPIRERIEVLLAGDSVTSVTSSLGLAVTLIGQSLDRDRPAMLLVYGDRFEALAAAVAAAYVRVPVVHMHGGDAAAGFSIDDSNRHAITKFAHLHLPATETHAKRIRRMGESADRVVVVGSPAIDTIRSGDYTSPAELKARLSLPFAKPTLLVLQHPVSSEATEAPRQIVETIEAVRALREPTLWIYPNADPGSGPMLSLLDVMDHSDLVAVRSSVAHADFLGAMAAATVMVGNSSSALIEAPSFGLPAVNIGTRQANRDRGSNVVDVGYDRREIEQAIRSALDDTALRKRIVDAPNPYGDGMTSARVASILEDWVPRREELLRKTWSD